MATLNFLRCTDNEFLAKHEAAVLLDDVAARRHRFAAGGDSNRDITIGLVSGVCGCGSGRGSLLGAWAKRRGGSSF